MRPALLFPIAIFTPFLLTAVLSLPVYAGICGAAYVIYMPASGAHPLADKLPDVFYMIDVYLKLFDYWMKNPTTLDVVHYTLPIMGLPLLGVLVALYLAYRLISGLLNLFRLSTNH